MIHFGFTGTQVGMTAAQRSAFDALLIRLSPGALHLGDCIGADTDAHVIALRLGWYLIGHPPIDDYKRSFLRYHEERNPLPFLIRNKGIVEECAGLIATPREYQMRLRSGTWSTVRYAQKIERPVMMVYPSGNILQLR